MDTLQMRGASATEFLIPLRGTTPDANDAAPYPDGRRDPRRGDSP